MIRAVIFDLDDTLYPEAAFVSQAFVRSAAVLAAAAGVPADTARREFVRLHRESRERVFDRAAGSLGFPVDLVPVLVSAYWDCEPELELFPGVEAVLQRLRQIYALGCVTDGRQDVQRRKLRALGLPPLVDAVIVNDAFGRDAWKPSPFGIQRCLAELGVDPRQAIFVGDNPFRDMPAAANAGVRAIRVRSGYFATAEGAPGVQEIPDIVCIESWIRQERSGEARL